MGVFEIYQRFAEIFEQNGFKLFIIGGTSRDLLLGKEPLDIDFVTDATPDQSKLFLEEVDMTFAKFGTIKVRYDNRSIDIVTLRKEEGYKDYRHPSKITFITSLEEDSKRRDFTINALYIDKDRNVIDYYNGLEDLKNKIIRFIGDPEVRIKEDPLRIIRAERFAKKLGFTIEEKSNLALIKYRYLLDELNPDKVKQELRKY